MNTCNRRRRLLALGAIATLPLYAHAQQQTLDRPLEQTYRVIVPQPPLEPGNLIEVVDFFWYG